MSQTTILSDVSYGEEHFHSACAFIETHMMTCLSFIRDGKNLGRWIADKPTVTECGRNLFKLSEPDLGYVKIDVRDDKCIYFHVGNDPDHLQNRIMVTVHEGPTFDGSTLGASGPTCLLYMVAWRVDDMTDTRWAELCAIHVQEVRTLKKILDLTS